jgi:hypothetical protein
VLTRFELIRFDAEVAAIYFIRSFRFRVELEDILAIVGFTLGVTLLACFFPPGARQEWTRPRRCGTSEGTWTQTGAEWISP